MNILFYVDYIKDKVGAAPSPAPTLAVNRVHRSTGVESVAVAAGAAMTASTLTGRYYYLLTGTDLNIYDYHGRATTSDTTVILREQPVLWTRWTESIPADSGGRVGINWGDVGSPTTTVGLSGTTIGTATTLTNAPPDSTGVTSLLGRVGAFTGTGVNTVLGFFKALLSKAAILPTDVGGTFDPTTDSTEAIRDRGDTAWTTATGFSTHTAADVWAAGTRTLTAGTNIVLAKGSGVTGFNDLDAAGVRTAVGLASANLDTQLDALPTAAEIVTAFLGGTPTPRNVTAVTVPTVADCLVAAFVGAAGAESVSGTTYLVKQPDGSATFRSFLLDSSSSPTSRT
jgi:hypothetical protein